MAKDPAHPASNVGTGTTTPSDTASVYLQDMPLDQMYGPWTHKALQSKLNGRPILSARRRSSEYRRSESYLRATSLCAEAMHERLVGLLETADLKPMLRSQEKQHLAANVGFLINMKKGETPPYHQITLALVDENKKKFRIDAYVRDQVIVEGNWECRIADGMMGFKDKVEEMVYGPKGAYMGI